MRPSIPESLSGIRRILTDVVGPELRTDFAKTNFERCLASLEEIEGRVLDVVPLLRREIGDLTGVLGAIDDDGVRLVAARDDVSGDPAATYDRVYGRYVALRQAATEFLDRAPSDTAGAEELRAYLRRAVNRSLGM